MDKLLSIIVPCYNEEEMIRIFYNEVVKSMSNISIKYEIIFIDDGSTDGSLVIIKELAKQDRKVKYVSFSRNFGKESAIYAGLENSKGDYVVLMDADLQDPPALLAEMIERIESGEYDCVATYRLTRNGEPVIRSFFAKMFYKLMHRISKTKIVPGARDFRMMSRRMVGAVISMTEYNRFSKGILSWVGFDTYWISYENKERVKGRSKWKFWELLAYSFDGIVAFSTVPLTISSVVGGLLCIAAGGMMLFYIIKTVIFGDPVDGFPSLISVILFLGGIQLLTIGIIGQYLSKTYLEVKKRPHYIKKESNIKHEI